jgi:hypothetical protein
MSISGNILIPRHLYELCTCRTKTNRNALRTRKSTVLVGISAIVSVSLRKIGYARKSNARNGKHSRQLPAVIDFHHIEAAGDTKVSEYIRNSRFGKAYEIIKSGEVIPLCANCHRIHHYNDEREACRAWPTARQMVSWRSGHGSYCEGLHCIEKCLHKHAQRYN